MKKFCVIPIYTNLPRFRRARAANARELYEKTKDWSGDYVGLTISDGVSEREVERVARKVGYQFKIETSDSDNENGTLTTSAFNIENAFQRYIKSKVRNKRKIIRLGKLGARLYEGDI